VYQGVAGVTGVTGVTGVAGAGVVAGGAFVGVSAAGSQAAINTLIPTAEARKINFLFIIPLVRIKVKSKAMTL
jgi:hypothetical protein